MNFTCEHCKGPFFSENPRHKYYTPKFCSMCKGIQGNNWAGGKHKKKPTIIVKPEKPVDLDEKDLW